MTSTTVHILVVEDAANLLLVEFGHRGNDLGVAHVLALAVDTIAVVPPEYAPPWSWAAPLLAAGTLVGTSRVLGPAVEFIRGLTRVFLRGPADLIVARFGEAATHAGVAPPRVRDATPAECVVWGLHVGVG